MLLSDFDAKLTSWNMVFKLKKAKIVSNFVCSSIFCSIKKLLSSFISNMFKNCINWREFNMNNFRLNCFYAFFISKTYKWEVMNIFKAQMIEIQYLRSDDFLIWKKNQYLSHLIVHLKIDDKIIKFYQLYKIII